MTKLKLLMGASALVAAAMAGQASATTLPAYGGGGSLVALAFREAADCFGTPTDFILENSTSTPATLTAYGQFDYTGHLAPYTAAAGPNSPTAGYNCAAEVTPGTPASTGDGPLNPNDVLYYISSGSGAGGASFMSHNTTAFWNDTAGTSPATPYPDVHFAESDAGLAVADVGIYNNGGVDATFKNVSVAGSANPSGTYANPAALAGAVVQIPLLVTPVVFAFDPVYKKVESGTGAVTSYSFHIAHPNVDGSGGIPMDITTICKIANGVITNWNDPALKALNSAISLRSTSDPEPEGTPTTPGTWEYTGAGGGLPIELVGRSDASGTTSIFARSMAAQCSMISGIATNFPTTGGLNLTTVISNTVGAPAVGGVHGSGTGGYSYSAGLWGLIKNSSGVASAVAFSASPTAFNQTLVGGRIGYLSPDYAWPAVQVSGFNGTYHLDVVDFSNTYTNSSGTHTSRIEPTVTATGLAFGTATLPPQSTAAGLYAPATTTHGLRNHPEDWVLPISTTYTLDGGPTVNNPLANAPTNPLAYPFVGTTQAFLYTCYNETSYPGVSAELKSFINFWFSNPIMTDPTEGLLAKNGFLPMPAAWKKAIIQTFAVPTTTGLTTAASPATANLSLAPEAVGYPGVSIEVSTTVTHPVTGTGSHAVTHTVTTKNYSQVEAQCATAGSTPAGTFTGAGA